MCVCYNIVIQRNEIFSLFENQGDKSIKVNDFSMKYLKIDADVFNPPFLNE